MDSVRKLLAITLLAIFALPVACSLFALTPANEANLPPCCRRNGAHHCIMNMAEANSASVENTGFSAVPEKCPFSPVAWVGAHHANALGAPVGWMIYAEVVSHPASRAQSEAKLRISEYRSHQKRGPPVIL